MNRKLNSKIAIGAIAAAFAAPAFAQDTGRGGMDWLTRWIPPSTTMIDTINGNDFRDNRDSTISRNDVPLDQTTLQQAEEPRGNAGTWRSSAAEGSGMSESRMSGEAPATAALPATAADEAPAAVVVTEPAQSVDEMAQQREVIVDTPADQDLSADAAIGESQVTERNPSGIDPVSDGAQDSVYTGIEGAGGADEVTAGRDDGQLTQ